MNHPTPDLAAVTVYRQGHHLTVLHDDPLLVAQAEAWQKKAETTPTLGSMAAWFQENRRRFQPGP